MCSDELPTNARTNTLLHIPHTYYTYKKKALTTDCPRLTQKHTNVYDTQQHIQTERVRHKYTHEPTTELSDGFCYYRYDIYFLIDCLKFHSADEWINEK